jgi:O-Antigen ligase
MAGIRSTGLPAPAVGAAAEPGLASVDKLRGRRPGSRTRSVPWLGWGAIGLCLVLATSPLDSGFFTFTAWGPIALVAMVVLIVLVRFASVSLKPTGIVAATGLAAWIALSAASILWAESKDSAWTSTNRIGFYGVVFTIVVVGVRGRRTGRALVLVLGASALATCVWLDCRFALGIGGAAFLGRRLNDPIGYINGTAALLVMGMWPWLAVAETVGSRVLRCGALAAATAIAATCVLCESRAVIPAAALSLAFGLLCAPGRVRRAVNVMLVAAAVALTLPWTLRVYSSGGAEARDLAPSSSLLMGAGLAILVAAVGVGLVHYAISRAAAASGAERRHRIDRLAGTGIIVGLVAALALGIAVGRPFLARQWHAFTGNHVDLTATNRFIDAGGYRYDLWRVALDEFDEHPLAGLGAGNYDAEYYRLRHNPEYVLQPHSLELQQLAELGVLGFVTLVLLCGGVIGAGLSRRGTLASEDPLIKVAAMGMFVAWLVSTSVDWPYDIPGIAGMAFVAAGLLVVPAARPAGAAGEGAASYRPNSRRVIWTLPALLAIALLAASIGRQYAATRYWEAGAAEVNRFPRRAIGTLREAAHLDPYSLNTLYALASAYARLDDYTRARGALLLAAAREPDNYVPPALLGDLAMRRGYRTLAADDYQRSIVLDPRDPALRQALNAALRAAG